MLSILSVYKYFTILWATDNFFKVWDLYDSEDSCCGTTDYDAV